jgi:hypothetical protein
MCLEGFQRYFTNDDGVVQRFVPALCLKIFDLSYDALAVDDFTEDDVLLVQMRGVDGRDEKLGAVGALIC